MKWVLVAFSLLFAPLGISAPSNEAALSSPLQKLFEFFSISRENFLFETQEQWLQRGKERWEFDSRYEEIKPLVWPLFEEMGMVQAVMPLQKEYDYALVHGALLSRVEERIAFLNALLEQGVRVRQIVFLTGKRLLLDFEWELTGLQTEREMVEWVYLRSDLPKEIPIFFVDAPPGEMERPQTKDTIASWLQSHPLPGTCLAISNQPYVKYQDAVLKKLLPNGFWVETVGPGIRRDPTVALMLDTIAQLFALDSE